MQLNKPSRKDRKNTSRHSMPVDNDFASLLYEDKSEKFKPILKWLFISLIIVAIGWGAFALFANNVGQKTSNSEYTTQANATVDNSAADAAANFSQCLSTVRSEHDTLNENSSDFYPRLIAVYDTWLGCYDNYPEATGRTSIESARQSAIDASGAYKSTYLSTNTYEYKPSSGASGTPSTANSSGNTGSGSNPATTTPSGGSTVDVQWCSAKKAEVDGLYADYQTARNKVSAIDAEIQKVSYSRPPGFTGTQSQLDAWRSSERQRLTNEKVPLVTQQNSAYSAYNSSNSEYRSKGCS